jgi:hypothetical protein
MPNLMMRFLISSGLFLLFVSCKTYEIPNATKIESSQKNVQNLYFSDSEKDYVYKASIDVYGKQLGGIFVAKKINDSIHRAVLTTDFGNTLLDFEVSENSFKVIYCVDELNKKIVLNTLKDDFRLVFRQNYFVEEAFENQSHTVYKVKDGKRFNYLSENKSDQMLTQLIHTTKTKEKVVIRFEGKNTTFAKKINIEHKNIKLNIELNQITN